MIAITGAAIDAGRLALGRLFDVATVDFRTARGPRRISAVKRFCGLVAVLAGLALARHLFSPRHRAARTLIAGE